MSYTLQNFHFLDVYILYLFYTTAMQMPQFFVILWFCFHCDQDASPYMSLTYDLSFKGLKGRWVGINSPLAMDESLCQAVKNIFRASARGDSASHEASGNPQPPCMYGSYASVSGTANT